MASKMRQKEEREMLQTPKYFPNKTVQTDMDKDKDVAEQRWV